MSKADHTIRLTEEISIPSVGFGTYLIPEDSVTDVVKTAIEVGYRHVDTAQGYGNEAQVGEAIKSCLTEGLIARPDLFVTTKLWPGNPAWGDPAKSKQGTIEAFDDSLAKLQLNYVDLFLIHAPSGGDMRIQQWEALVELRELGKVRAIGVSNFSEAHIEELKAAGLPMPNVDQIELHPWSQKPELVDYLVKNDIKPIAYSSLVPLSTWRMQDGQDSAKTAQMKADGAGAASPFKAMAEKYDVSEAQVLLRWGVQKGYPVLPKSTNEDRMRQNLDLFSFEIDAADMALIDTMDRGAGVAWAVGDPTMMG